MSLPALRRYKHAMREMWRRGAIVAEAGYKPTWNEKCEVCERSHGAVYAKDDEWVCVACLTMHAEPRVREELAARFFPEGGFSILGPGEPPPWAR